MVMSAPKIDGYQDLQFIYGVRPTSTIRNWSHNYQAQSIHQRQYSEQHLLRFSSSQKNYVVSSNNLPTPSSSLSDDLSHYGCITMERTPSGNSIWSSSPSEPLPTIETIRIHQKNDLAAAERVENWVRHRPQNSKHERILRKLIRLDEPLYSGFTLDNSALESILTAADTLFFDGVLAGRVQWEWSSGTRYRTELIGTTALRRCFGREGFETLIILSEPVLRDERYDRRLLLSVFLHELIHCYLFISCGFEARIEGGHTAGFYHIAQVIDSWVGPNYLSICKPREDPERFHI